MLGRVAVNWIIEARSQQVSKNMVCARSDVSTVSAVEEKEKTFIKNTEPLSLPLKLSIWWSAAQESR
jgi:hypothetical protein